MKIEISLFYYYPLVKMDHPNIMKAYFSFAYINDETNERFYYIGMECAPYDLAKILKQKKVNYTYNIVKSIFLFFLLDTISIWNFLISFLIIECLSLFRA